MGVLHNAISGLLMRHARQARWKALRVAGARANEKGQALAARPPKIPALHGASSAQVADELGLHVDRQALDAAFVAEP